MIPLSGGGSGGIFGGGKASGFHPPGLAGPGWTRLLVSIIAFGWAMKLWRKFSIDGKKMSNRHRNVTRFWCEKRNRKM